MPYYHGSVRVSYWRNPELSRCVVSRTHESLSLSFSLYPTALCSLYLQITRSAKSHRNPGKKKQKKNLCARGDGEMKQHPSLHSETLRLLFWARHLQLYTHSRVHVSTAGPAHMNAQARVRTWALSHFPCLLDQVLPVEGKRFIIIR